MGTKACVDQGPLNRVTDAIDSEENFISFGLVVMLSVDGHVGFVRLHERFFAQRVGGERVTTAAYGSPLKGPLSMTTSGFQHV